jgi:hypothetical protein
MSTLMNTAVIFTTFRQSISHSAAYELRRSRATSRAVEATQPRSPGAKTKHHQRGDLFALVISGLYVCCASELVVFAGDESGRERSA